MSKREKDGCNSWEKPSPMDDTSASSQWKRSPNRSVPELVATTFTNAMGPIGRVALPRMTPGESHEPVMRTWRRVTFLNAAHHCVGHNFVMG